MANNTPVKDGTGATVTAATQDIGSGVQAPKVVPVDTGGNPLNVAAGSLVAGAVGPLMQAAVASPTYTTAQINPLTMDTNGKLRVAVTNVTDAASSGAADAGAPVKVGGKYNSTTPTFTDGNRGDAQLDVNGNLRVRAGFAAGTGADTQTNSIMLGARADTATGTGIIGIANFGLNGAGTWARLRGDENGLVTQRSLVGSMLQYAGVTGGITNTSDVAVFASAGGSLRNYMDSFQYQNFSATASEIVIKDGSTVIWRGYAPANMTAPANVTFASPLKGTAATAMNVAMITTATTTIVSCQGHTGI